MEARKKISPSLRWHRRRAIEFRRQGLNSKGKPYQRRRNAENGQIRLALRRDRNLKAWNNRVMRFKNAGMTTRGTKRIYAVRRGDALLLRTQIDRLITEIGKVFGELPARAQAAALELEKTAGEIRRQTD